MSKSTSNRFRYWSRMIGLLVIVYTVVGLLVDMAVPQILPDNALTASVGDAAKSGAFAIWFYLLWRIFNTIRGIYGPDSIHYLQYSLSGADANLAHPLRRDNSLLAGNFLLLSVVRLCRAPR